MHTTLRMANAFLLPESPMKFDQPTELLYDFDLNFPPLSRTVAEVSDLLASNGMPDTDRLIEIVHMDPLVVASVLRRINSAFYGMRRQFQDIRKAILMIGFIEVCNIVLASGYVGLRKSIVSSVHAELIDRIMRVSICSGFYANLLAMDLNLPDKSSAFTGGLLHSIGRFVLLYNVPEQYLQLSQHTPEDYIPSARAEQNEIGVDHPTIGSIAAQHWNFPPVVTSLIESYQNPGHLDTDDHRKLALTLSASVEIAHNLSRFFETARETIEIQDMESPLEDFPLPFPLKASKALKQLARTSNRSVEELMQQINESQKEALHYVELMMRI